MSLILCIILLLFITRFHADAFWNLAPILSVFCPFSGESFSQE